MSTRYITIENNDIKDLVTKKGDLVAEGRKLYEEIEKLQEEGKEIATKIQAVKDEVIPMIAEEVKSMEIGEYEAVGSTEIIEGELKVSVIDQLEDFKARHKKAKEDAERQEKGEFSEEEKVMQEQQEFQTKVQSLSAEEMKEVLPKLLEVLK